MATGGVYGPSVAGSAARAGPEPHPSLVKSGIGERFAKREHAYGRRPTRGKVGHEDRRLSMARLIYSAISSLDGYVADEDGNFDWAVPDEEVHTFINNLERQFGT